MDDLSFLETFGDYSISNATLKVVLPDGQVCLISDRICPYQFLDHCPLLYHAFEYGFQSRLQANIEAPSTSAVVSLLRYCYTGSYLPNGVDDTNLLLLQHAQTYKLAEDYDVPELQLQAHGNFSCQIDYACSHPTPPLDLLETIRFIYEHFASQQSRQQHSLVDTLLNYCISVFLYHKLGEEPEFLKVVSEIPAFRQDLCRTNMGRNFEDDCAFHIVRLALVTLQAPPSVRPTTLASRDLPEEMLYDVPSESSGTQYDPIRNLITTPTVEFFDPNNTPTNGVADQPSVNASATTTLVHRPKILEPKADTGFETDSSSDEDGFSMVYHPKPLPYATPDEPMSSPELIPSAPIDVLAATGSDYPSDDEWSMV